MGCTSKSAIKVTFLTLAVLCGLISLALFFIVPSLILREVVKEDYLGRSGNDSYNIVTRKYLKPAYSIQLQVWTYSVDNAERVVALGEKPRLRQKGPYTFVEVTEKRWFQFSANDTRLLYRNNRRYTFSQNLSCAECHLTDMVMVPNVLFAKLAEACRNVAAFVCEPLDVALRVAQEGPFIYVSTADLLFDGYVDPLIGRVCNYNALTRIACKVLKIPDRIGILYGKNNTDDGLYEIGTSLNGAGDLGRMYSWNGMTKLNSSYWYGEQARMINGTDGQLFPPGLKVHENLPMFMGQVCRSVELEHYAFSAVQGVPAHRYRPSPSSMQDVSLQKAMGFCNPNTPAFFNDTSIQQPGCAPSGLLDVGTCAPGKPAGVLASQSHFYGSPDALWQAIEILNGPSKPSAVDDSTYLDIEPISGVVLRAKSRSQINLGLTAGKFRVFAKLPNVIVPMIWMNESALIDDDTMAQVLRPIHALADAFYAALALLVFATVFLVSFGGVVLGERIIQRRNAGTSGQANATQGGYDPLVEDDEEGESGEEGEHGGSLPGMPSPMAPTPTTPPTPLREGN